MPILDEVYTTKEISDKLNKNHSYVLRTAKKILKIQVDYRKAGTRNYLFTENAYLKLKKYFESLTP